MNPDKIFKNFAPVDLEEAGRLVQAFREKFPERAAQWKKLQQQLPPKMYGGRFVENVVQSTASELFYNLQRRIENLPTRFPGVVIDSTIPDSVVITDAGPWDPNEVVKYLAGMVD